MLFLNQEQRAPGLLVLLVLRGKQGTCLCGHLVCVVTLFVWSPSARLDFIPTVCVVLDDVNDHIL